MRLETPALGRLREWGPSPVWPEGRDLFLLRPLLALSRETLRRRLGVLGLAFLEDPANGDEAFLRARARAALRDLPRSPPLAAAEGPAPAGAALARFGAEGQVELPSSLILGEGGARLAAMALACASGRETPPRGRAVVAALARLAGAESGRRVEVGGACMTLGADLLAFGRDPGAQRRDGAPPLRLRAGALGVFDGRFEIMADQDLDILPLFGRGKRLKREDRTRLAALAPRLRAALPALCGADGAVALPAPWGRGPARARTLVGGRFAAAAGLVRHERDILR